MPSWLIPVLKSVLPYVGTIITAAAPVFTKKSADASANQTILQQQQISELQAAVSANDAHIKELAIQIQTALAAVEEGALLAEKRNQRVMVLSISAIIISMIALAISIYPFFAH